MLLKFIKYWLPPIVWGIAIFSVSSGSVPQVSPVYWENFAAHKTAHIIEYGILGILVYRATIQEKITRWKAVLFAVLICGVYGMTDEFHQRFTPTRESRFRDVIIDTIGASVGILIVWKLLPKLPAKLLTWGKKLDLL